MTPTIREVRSARWVAALFLMIVLLQRVGIPGVPNIGLLTPLVLGWVVVAYLQGVVVVHRQSVLWLLAVVVATGGAMLVQSSSVFQAQISVTSWLLILAVWTPFTVRLVEPGVAGYFLMLRYATYLTIALATASIAMLGSQLAGLPFRDWFGAVVPQAFQLDGFNTIAPTAYGSDVIRSMAWIGLEPSVVSALLGLGIALLLDRAFLGRGVVRTLLITPFLITPVAGALIWKTTILDPNNGILNWVLSLVGIGPVDWIGQFPLAMVMVELIWQWTPFMMLLILAGLTSMPRDQLEAGRVDGATAIQLFRELTLPHLRRFIELGVVLGAIYLVNTFDAIFMMTQGGPGVASANLPFYIYQRAFLGFDMGQAAAMGVVVVIFTMIIASFALRLIFKSFSGKEEAA